MTRKTLNEIVTRNGLEDPDENRLVKFLSSSKILVDLESDTKSPDYTKSYWIVTRNDLEKTLIEID